jgi:hypothetical protein
MYMLRTLSFRDLVRALQHRELRVAGCIARNLIRNAFNNGRAGLNQRSHALNRVVRRAT